MAKVLLLDDNETILKIVSNVLTSKGHKVTFCKSAIDALEEIKRKPYDLVITDLLIPGGTNGFDVIRTIRKDPDVMQMPIIVITGQRREKKDVERAIQNGANDYIVKPINPEILKLKVDEVLKSTQATKKVFDYSIVNAKGLWESELRIVKLTEQGLEIKSPLLVPVDTKIRILSDWFKELGIETPWVRVTSCTRSQDKDGYDVSVKFVELTEKQTGPIKDWIRMSNKKAS